MKRFKSIDRPNKPWLAKLISEETALEITCTKASAMGKSDYIMPGTFIDEPEGGVPDSVWRQAIGRMVHLNAGEDVELVSPPMITIGLTDHFSSGMLRADAFAIVMCVRVGRSIGLKPCTSLSRAVMRAMVRGEHRAIEAGRRACGKLEGGRDLVPSELYIDRSGARREYLP